MEEHLIELNSKLWKKLIVNEYCKCKVDDREKVTLTDDLGENCDMCLTCNKEIEIEKDEKEEELDMSESPDVVPDMTADYEFSQNEEQADFRSDFVSY